MNIEDEESAPMKPDYLLLSCIVSLFRDSPSPEEFIRSAIHEMVARLDFRGGAAYLLNGEGNLLELWGSSGIPRDVEERFSTIFVGEGISEEILKGKIIYQNAGDLNSRYFDTISRLGIRSLLSFPLSIQKDRGGGDGEEAIGIVHLFSDNTLKRGKDFTRFIRESGKVLGSLVVHAREMKGLGERVEEWRIIFDYITDPISFHDKDHRILNANRAFSERHGLPLEEIVGKTCYSLIHKTDEPIEECPHRQAMKRYRPVTVEITNPEAGKTVQISCYPLMDGIGNLQGSIHIAKDITEEKNMRSKLFETARFKALGEVSAGVAHNFNHLLSVILGRVEYLGRRVEDEEVERVLRIIKKVALDGAEMARRIHDFGKPKRDETHVPLNINRLVMDAVEMTASKWRDEAQERGVNIEMSIDAPAELTVMGKEGELREVLTNLILNAVDSLSKSGGKIGVEARGEDGRVFLRVSDTGEGMDEETEKRIFEPFFTTKAGKGLGLGLTVSKAVVQNHGGTITVSSRKGEGATFTITLPAGESSPPAEEVEDRLEEKVEGKILVIEDDIEFKETIEDLLKCEGFHLTSTTSGREGLTLLNSGRFDALITDLSLPEISGWEIVRRAREIVPDIPVIVLTGWSRTRLRDEVKFMGIDAVLTKPCPVQELTSTILKVLREKREGGGGQEILE